MILHEGLSISEVSRRLGIDYSVVWRWKRKFGKLFTYNDQYKGSNEDLHREVLELNAKLAKVIEERDTLMKALSHFIAQ